MKYFIAALLFFPISLFASVYDLKVAVAINQETVIFSNLKIHDGETGFLSQEVNGKKVFIESRVDKKDTNNVLMNFELGYLKNDGSRQVISTPRVVGLLGEEAQVITERENAVISLRVTAEEAK